MPSEPFQFNLSFLLHPKKEKEKEKEKEKNKEKKETLGCFLLITNFHKKLRMYLHKYYSFENKKHKKYF